MFQTSSYQTLQWSTNQQWRKCIWFQFPRFQKNSCIRNPKLGNQDSCFFCQERKFFIYSFETIVCQNKDNLDFNKSLLVSLMDAKNYTMNHLQQVVMEELYLLIRVTQDLNTATNMGIIIQYNLSLILPNQVCHTFQALEYIVQHEHQHVMGHLCIEHNTKRKDDMEPSQHIQFVTSIKLPTNHKQNNCLAHESYSALNFKQMEIVTSRASYNSYTLI